MNIQQPNKLQTFVPKMQRVQHIHFVGIGGSGMCGIAEILASEGYKISGSDLTLNIMMQKLISIGVKIFLGHRPENIKEASVVVVSSAIDNDNPEIKEATAIRTPIIKRAEMLAELMRFRHGIAVAGTHGKTTTTAMVASIYDKAGMDPTFINGGIIKSDGTNAKLGLSKYFIVEADESDASFLYLHPMVSVITNIECDHMKTYQGNLENLKLAFISFLHNLPFYGHAVMCIDDPITREILIQIDRSITTYGFSKDADVHIEHYQQKGTKVVFTIRRCNKPSLLIKMNIPGYHNVLNAAAAISVATEEGIDDNSIIQALFQFKGTDRRFDILGSYDLENINSTKGTIMLVDDFGHHPTEIDATIKTVRAGWPDKRLVMVFQPHRYTRTKDFYNDFANVLNKVDILFMLDVYPAGEAPIIGIDSQTLCRTISNLGHINTVFVVDTNTLLLMLKKSLQDNDLLLMQGAGTIGNIASNLAKKLQINKNEKQYG